MKKTAPQTIGKRIKAERTRLDLSQMALAIKCKSTPTTISKLELDKIELGRDLGERICEAFGGAAKGWTLDYLCYGTR